MRIFILAALLGLLGCPSTQRGPIAIERVVPDGALRGRQAFRLSIDGRGFGLSAVRFDLDEGAGQATAIQYQVRILDQFGNIHGIASGTQVAIRSPAKIEADFVLPTPLEPKTYGVDIVVDGAGGASVARLETAFEVESAGPPPRDAGVPDRGVLGPPDLGTPDLGPRPDAGAMDAGPADASPAPDATPADAGGGPWVGQFRFRREVRATRPMATPSGVTLAVPVPHRSMSRAGQAEANAADLALYLGDTALETQIDDRAKIDTEELVLIARLPAVAAGPISNLYLYSGDPNAAVSRTDTVYVLAERFDADLRGDWFLNNWQRLCTNRVGRVANGSVCVRDEAAGLSRRTVGSPPQTGMLAAPGAGLSYVLAFHFAGTMEQPNDLLYFSYSQTNNDFASSTLLDDGAYSAFPPNAATTFDETNGQSRTVRGWRLPNTPPGLDWTRVSARFLPRYNRPSLHFRFISVETRASNVTVVAVDDLTVRLAAEPDFALELGPVEAR